MNINAMLEYQNLDRDILKLNNEFKSNKTVENYSKYVKLYKQAVEDGKRLSGNIAEHFVNFERLNAQYDKLIADVDEYRKGLADISDVKQAEYFEKQLSKLFDSLDGIEKELNAVRKELSNCDGDAKTFFTNINNYFGNVKNLTPATEELKAQTQKKIKEIMLKQKEIEKSIEPELLEKYKRAKEIAKFPPMVPYNEEARSCGCGIELSSDIAGKLSSGSMCVEFCPNCNRLVYKK